MNKKKLLGVLIISVGLLIVLALLMLRRGNNYVDFVIDNAGTAPVQYDPSKEQQMLDKVLGVIDDCSIIMRDYGIVVGGITEEMMSYSADTSRVVVIFDRDDGQVYLNLHFNDDGSIVEYNVDEPGDSGDDPTP